MLQSCTQLQAHRKKLRNAQRHGAASATSLCSFVPHDVHHSDNIVTTSTNTDLKVIRNAGAAAEVECTAVVPVCKKKKSDPTSLSNRTGARTQKHYTHLMSFPLYFLLKEASEAAAHSGGSSSVGAENGSVSSNHINNNKDNINILPSSPTSV